MRHHHIVIGYWVLTTAVVAGIVYWVYWAPWKRVEFTPPGVVITYNSRDLNLERLNGTQGHTTELVRLFQGDQATSPILVECQYETGLRLAVNVTKQDLRTMLATNAQLALRQRFKDFQEISVTNTTVAQRDAVEITFTYSGLNEQKNQQRFIAVTWDDDTALYCSFQASYADFSRFDQRYFSPIIHSVQPMLSPSKT